jgi:Tfp pilus assembly protein PilX
MRQKIMYSESGLVLVVSLLLMAAIFLILSIAIMTTATDLKITGHFKSGKNAFYAAEAGVEESRAAMRTSAANPITDNYSTQTGWSAYIGTTAKTQGKGYNSSNAMHARVNSVQSVMDYVVKIVHQTDGSGNILYWGDANQDGISERTTTTGAAVRNIYKVTSEGASAGSKRTVEAEMSRVPPVAIRAALSVGASTTVQGSSTNVIGTDGCGGGDLPGIVTTQPSGSVTLHGAPNITGAGGATPNITYNAAAIDIQSIINTFKAMANFQYTVHSATHTASTRPGPGDGWGTPVPGGSPLSPSSCAVHNIVYYNTGGTDIQLSGGVSGCGILLVDGDAQLGGNFSWYGVILTSGSLTFTGGGNKNVTGAILSGGSTDADLVGGNSKIVYCSTAVRDQTDTMPMQLLSWSDKVAQ